MLRGGLVDYRLDATFWLDWGRQVLIVRNAVRGTGTGYLAVGADICRFLVAG